MRKWPPAEMRIGRKLEITALGNTISLCEQIQLVKMASSWNEDWEEIRNRCSRKYNITLWTNTTCENGLQPKWGLGGGLVWPSSSSIVTLWEFFLLIWILEACTRSIFLNMSTLQCNFFPGSAFVSQFPTFWGIGNPTDFQVSWGTWLAIWWL